MMAKHIERSTIFKCCCRKFKVNVMIFIIGAVVLIMYAARSRGTKGEAKQTASDILTTRTLHTLDQNDKIIQYVTELSTDSPVLISVIDQESIPFGHNWLCNVQDFAVYDKVILLATDILDASFYKMWPNICVFNIQDRLKFAGNSRRLQVDQDKTVSTIVKSILHTNHSVLLFSIKSIWLQDATTLIQYAFEKDSSKDVITSLFEGKSKTFDFYFTYFKARKALIQLLDHYETVLHSMYKRLSNHSKNSVADSENQRNYFSQLLHRRYGRVKYSVFPLTKVADYNFYRDLNETSLISYLDKSISQLHVLRSYSLENKKNIKEVMNNHGHWFIDKNYKCDYNKVVRAEKSVWNLKTN